MAVDQVVAVRRFNRTYTPRIGVLDDSFLGSGLPLGAARVLFEIGLGGAGVLDLRQRLGLDSGYLSRLLRQLQAEGLVRVVADPDDRRRRMCRLTADGARRWKRLDARSDEIAAELLRPLTPGQRARLTDALATADGLLRAAAIVFRPVDPTGPAATEAMRAYFAELDERFVDGFDPGDALGAGAAAMAAPDGVFVLALADDGQVAGCGGLQRLDAATGEVKRMWVHPAWRGTGIGRRLLAELEDHAARLGYPVVVLDTNATLTEAIGMYSAAGYVETDRYNDNPYAERWFRKVL